MADDNIMQEIGFQFDFHDADATSQIARIEQSLRSVEKVIDSIQAKLSNLNIPGNVGGNSLAPRSQAPANNQTSNTNYNNVYAQANQFDTKIYNTVFAVQNNILKVTQRINAVQKDTNTTTQQSSNQWRDILNIVNIIPSGISSIATEIGNTVQAISESISRAEDASVILLAIKVAVTVIKRTIEAIKGVIDVIGKALNVVYEVLKGIIGFTLQLYGYLGKIVGTIAGTAILTPVKTLFNTIKDGIGDTIKRVTSFISSIKRIALYRFIRFLIKQVTDAFKTGLENIYQYSLTTLNEVTTSFSTSMDSIATDLQYFKNSIGSVIAPLMEMLAPLIRQVVDALVEFNNKVAQVFATLNGQTSYMKAVRAYKAYAKEANKATKANKELKKSFAGLDEITVIGQKDSSSSKKKSGDDTDYSVMFETVNIESKFAEIGNKIKQFWDELKEGFSEGDISAPLTKVAGAINNFVHNLNDTLDWKKIAPTIDKFWNTISSGFSALVDPNTGIDFYAIGQLFANLASIIVRSLYDIFTFDWPSLFKGLAKSVNGFFENFDWEGLGLMIEQGIVQVFDSLAAFIDELEWAMIADKILLALLTINYGDVFTAVTDYVIAIFDAFNEIFSDPTQFELLAIRIAYGINQGINNLAENAETIAEGISNFAICILDTITAFVSRLDWKRLGETIGAVLGNMKWDEIATSMGNAAEALCMGLIDFVTGLTEDEENWNNFVNGLSTVLTTLMDKIDFKRIFEALKPLVEGLLQKILPLVLNIAGDLFNSIAGVLNTVMPYVWELLKMLVGNILSKLKHDVLEGIGIMLGNVLVSIKNFFTNLWNNLKDAGIKVVEFFKNPIESIKGFFTSIPETISSAFRNSANGLIDMLNNIIGGLNTVLDGMSKVTGTKWTIDPIPRFATGGFPEDGLFMANHGELVGRFADGRTAVANNQQIVEGISQGVYSAQSEQNELLREQNSLLRQLLDKNNSISVSTITRGLQKQNQRVGRAIVGVS